METYEGRLATFAAQPRRRHHPVPSSWPHGLDFSVTPATLAAAGFRYDPTPSGDDNVTCVYCSRGLEGWEEGDDALDEHLKRHDSFTGEQCPWATVMGAKRDYEAARSRGTSLATLEEPTTSRLENARRNTFGKWWTFDGKKNWKPTSGRLAAAGFYNTPLPDGATDTCACIYCDIQLDGWSKNDDPVEEHQSRRPDCYFFTHDQLRPSTSKNILQASTRPAKDGNTARANSTAARASTVDGKKGKRGAAQQVVELSLTSDVDENQEPLRATTSAKPKVTKGSKSQSVKARASRARTTVAPPSDSESVLASEANTAAEDGGQDDAESVQAVESPPPKTARGRTSKAPKAKVRASTRSVRTRAESVQPLLDTIASVTVIPDDNEDQEQDARTTISKPTRAGSRQSKATSQVVKPIAAASKPSKSRSKKSTSTKRPKASTASIASSSLDTTDRSVHTDLQDDASQTSAHGSVGEQESEREAGDAFEDRNTPKAAKLDATALFKFPGPTLPLLDQQRPIPLVQSSNHSTVETPLDKAPSPVLRGRPSRASLAPTTSAALEVEQDASKTHRTSEALPAKQLDCPAHHHRPQFTAPESRVTTESAGNLSTSTPLAQDGRVIRKMPRSSVSPQSAQTQGIAMPPKAVDGMRYGQLEPTRSQSALDSLLAQAMPEFSPEKTMSAVEIPETSDKPAAPTKEPDFAQVTHVPSLLLSEAEASMTVQEWVEELTRKEIEIFTIQSRQILETWRRKVAEGRDELLRTLERQ